MQAIKQTVTVPSSRELNIKLPDDAVAHEEAEVIVLFKSSRAGDEKLAAMEDAMTDEAFLADLHETMSDFAQVDGEVRRP